MNSTTSSLKQINKVSSDSNVIGFDLLSHLTYMSVLTAGGLSRDRVFEHCSRQRYVTAVFFEYVYLLVISMGMGYAQAFQLVSGKAKASNVKSLFLRFAASLSSGESERDFVIEETNVESKRYANEYERSVENLRKWTDAYAAILVSVTLIMVVSLVSAMMGSLSEHFIIIMAFTLFFITSVGVYTIYKVAPVETKIYTDSTGMTKERRRARTLILVGPPIGIGIMAVLVIGLQLDLLAGFSVAFLLIGVSLLPGGYYIWKDDARVTQLDLELPTFIRSLGAIAGSTKVTLTQALYRIDSRSMGSLGPHIERLRTRLIPQLPPHECWEMFRRETGSELANRTTTMMVDATQLGSQPGQVGQIVSDYAMSITQLRAGRQLTASTFSFLTMAMHATMVFILVFVLEIIDTFNSMLAVVSSEVLNESAGGVEIPDNVQLPPGISIPKGGDLAGGLDIFGSQDMTITSYAIIMVIIILTVANSLAPKFTTGGSNLKIASYLGIMCVVSGIVLGVVPMLTAKLFVA